MIGGGTGIWSFIEITDAAAATVAAVGRGAPGVYNVVDGDPASVAEWLPYLARVVCRQIFARARQRIAAGLVVPEEG